jgi:hypothetical protein
MRKAAQSDEESVGPLSFLAKSLCRQWDVANLTELARQSYGNFIPGQVQWVLY